MIESVSGEEIVLLKERELESCSNRMKDFSTILPETKVLRNELIIEAIFLFAARSKRRCSSSGRRLLNIYSVTPPGERFFQEPQSEKGNHLRHSAKMEVPH